MVSFFETQCSSKDSKQKWSKAIVYSRLYPPLRCATYDVYLLIFIVEQNLVGINAGMSAVTLSPLKHT